MRDLSAHTELNLLLNEFSVPMFAVDRATPACDFRVVALNRAFEEAGAPFPSGSMGRSIYELLPELDADAASQRYSECAMRHRVVRCRDAFSSDGSNGEWDTTLQYVPLKNGGDRVVGTTFKSPESGATSLGFSAPREFGALPAMADLQLQNLMRMFEVFRGMDLLTVENRSQIAKLGRTCRTVHTTISDVKNAAQTARILQGGFHEQKSDPNARAWSGQTSKALSGGPYFPDHIRQAQTDRFPDHVTD